MKKMDEMELQISQKSLKVSFVFMICALGLYTIYGIKTKTTKIPLMILIIQNLSYLLAKFFYEKKYGVNEHEE